MTQRLFTDMLGREVEINFTPQRIISLVPSQTELLYDLGLDEEVIGITKFCVHPQGWLKKKQKVGGTKKVNLNIVKALEPDLIIANKEENEKYQIDQLAEQYPVWVSDVTTIFDAYRMMLNIGAIIGKGDIASALFNQIQSGLVSFPKNKPLNVVYFIWRNPWLSVGGDTFINNMIEAIGWNNIFANKLRYPEITPEELVEKKPDLVLLSSEPYPFKEANIAEMKMLLPESRIILVDGEMFSWYGSRMRLAVTYLAELVSQMN